MADPAGPAGADRVAARNAASLAAGEMTARVVSFFAGVVTARVLGPEYYGVVGVALAVMLYLAIVNEWGLELMGAKELASGGEAARQAAPQVHLGRFLLSVILAAAVAVVALPLLPNPDGKVLAAYGLTLLPVGANPRWIFFGLQRTAAVSLTRLLSELIKLGLIVAFIRGPDDILWVPLAQAIGDGTGALFLLSRLPRLGFRLSLHFSPAVVLPVLRRSFPLMAAPLLSLVTYNADVIMLRALRSKEEAGFYLAAYMLISYLGVIGTVARYSLVPALAARVGDRAAEGRLLSAFLLRTTVISLPVAIGGMLVASQIIGLAFGDDYAPAAAPLRLLVWSVIPLLSTSVLEAWLIAHGRQHRVLAITAWAAALTVVANLLLIPRFGMAGAALTTVGCEVGRLGLTSLTLGRAAWARIRLRPLLLPAVAAVVLWAVLVAVGSDNLAVNLALGGLAYGLPMAAGLLLSRARPVTSPLPRTPADSA